MRAHIKTGVLATLAAAASASAAATRIIDHFSDTTLDPRWVLDESPDEDLYGPGGGFVLDGEGARFNNVSNYHYAHVETATTYDSTAGLRADAIMRQQPGPTSTWGMSVALYYDTENWVAITQGSAPSQYGWMKQVMHNGTLTQTMASPVQDLRARYLISGIELTASDIKFYGTNMPSDDIYRFETNIAANSTLINAFTMARPAEFSGPAKLIFGKGHSRGPASSWPNPDWDNDYGPAATDHDFSGLTYARITLPVAGLQSGDAGFGKEWVRSHPLTIQADSWDPPNFDHDEYFAAGMNTLNLGPHNGVPVENRPLQYANSPWIGWIQVNADGKQDFDEWTHLPGNIGWIVGDEVVGAAAFAAVAAQIAFVRQGDIDTRRLVYTNAGPQSSERGTGAAYVQHLRDLVDAVNPDVLSYDIYPFFADGSRRADYLENIMGVRQVGLEKDRPYFAFLQGFHDSVSESANRYNVFTHLTAGFTGLHYWTYDYRDGLDGLIDEDGNPTGRYFSAAGTNAEAIKLGTSLRFLESTGVRFVSGGIGSIPTGVTNWSGGAGGDSHIQSISVVSPDHADKDGLIGFFTDDSSQQHFMLTNLYHGTIPGLSATAASLSFSMTFDASVDKLLRLNRSHGGLELLLLNNHTLNLVLPGGTGDLFKYDMAPFAGMALPKWNVNANGNWTSAGNWANGVPNAVGAAANFTDGINTAHTVTVNAPQTVGFMFFDNAGASYTVDGSSAIMMDVSSGAAGIGVSSGNHTISAPVTLADDTLVSVTPAGSTLSVTSQITALAGVDLLKDGAGTLAVNGVRADGLSIDDGTVQMITSGNTNANVSRVNSLSIAAGSTLDLKDNDLIVDGGDYSAMQSLVIQGYNNGNWLGTGITSSAAAANASLFALGVADNDDLNNTEFSGETGLDGDEILVKHTYVGDANLTGGVNLDDFNQFLFGFNPANAAPQIWLNGDFNYTGAVNLDDFNLFLFGLANQGGALVTPELFATLSDFVAAEGIDVDLSAVPEPAAGLFGVVAGLLMWRSRQARRPVQ